MNIICVGDNVCDQYHYKNTYYPGGNCVNVAVNAKRNGAETATYIGIFGTDDKAEHLKNVLDQEGVNWERSRTMEGKTGQPGVYLDESGDRFFKSYPYDTVATLAKLRMTKHDLEYIRNYDVLHTSCYSWMEEELPALSEIIDIAYDFSDHITNHQIRRVAPWIRYAFVSASGRTEQEIDELIDEFSQFSNIEVLGITRGSLGAMFIHNGKTYCQPPKQANVIDTMGAGDSFIAGFLVAWKSGNSMEDALSNGANSAARTCEVEGGFGYPHAII